MSDYCGTYNSLSSELFENNHFLLFPIVKITPKLGSA